MPRRDSNNITPLRERSSLLDPSMIAYTRVPGDIPSSPAFKLGNRKTSGMLLSFSVRGASRKGGLFRIRYSFGMLSSATTFIGAIPECPSGIRAQSVPSKLKCTTSLPGSSAHSPGRGPETVGQITHAARALVASNDGFPVTSAPQQLDECCRTKVPSKIEGVMRSAIARSDRTGRPYQCSLRRLRS